MQGVESNGQGWQVVRPGDCAIAFGIPVSTSEILQNSNKGFASQFHIRGRIEEFVKDHEMTTAAMKQCDAQVVTNLTLERFRELFNRHAVIVLFSHTENGTIEFEDGFVDVDTVAVQIPQSFDGVVDITTCYSIELFRAIRRDRPNCFPFYATEKRLDAVPWLFFYKALFEYLKSKELTYQAASQELVHEFFDCVRKELPRMKLPELLKLYLDRIGRGDAPHLGSSRPVTEEDNRFLAELLSKRVGATDYFIVLALIIIGVSYAVAIFVVLYVRNDALTLKIVFAALLTFTLASLAWLRRWWIDKSVMNILILALRDLPPESAAAFVDAFYWKGNQRAGPEIIRPATYSRPATGVQPTPTTLTPSNPPEVFISYSHEDEEWLERLVVHLNVLKNEGIITVWHGLGIPPGEKWEEEIEKHLTAAQIILLLVSKDFIKSDYCYGVETKKAMKRHKPETAYVIPVILRPCNWRNTLFGKLQALPRGAKPIVEWNDFDEALDSVTDGIRQVVKRLPPPRQHLPRD